MCFCFSDQEAEVTRTPEGVAGVRFRLGVFEIDCTGDSRRHQSVMFARFYEGGRAWLTTS